MKKYWKFLSLVAIITTTLIITISIILYNVVSNLHQDYKIQEEDNGIRCAYDIRNDIKDLYLEADVDKISFDWNKINLEKIYYEGTLEQWINIKFINTNSNDIPLKHNTSFKHLYLKNDYNEWEELTDLVIPEGIEVIKAYSFENLVNLRSIKFNDSIKEIGEFAFAGCTSLKEVTLPNTISSISCGLFYGCSQLETVILPSNLISIKQKAFINCLSLHKLELPISLKSIGNYSFQNCLSLNNIELPLNIKTIGDAAFQNCEALEEIHIPNNVEILSSNIFKNCYNLKYVDLSASVKTIYSYAFDNCHSLEIVNVSNPQLKIFNYAFKNAEQFLTLEDNIYYLNYKDNIYHFTVTPKDFDLYDYIILNKNTKFVNLTTTVKDSSSDNYTNFKVLYEGSKDEYISNNITIDVYEFNDIYHYSSIKPNDDGLYWHYINNKIVIW